LPPPPLITTGPVAIGPMPVPPTAASSAASSSSAGLDCLSEVLFCMISLLFETKTRLILGGAPPFLLRNEERDGANYVPCHLSASCWPGAPCRFACAVQPSDCDLSHRNFRLPEPVLTVRFRGRIDVLMVRPARKYFTVTSRIAHRRI